MAETIVDSKFRILEPLPKLAGRTRYRASDLIRGRIDVLECPAADGFDRIAGRWTEDWLPALRNRIERFAALPSFVPVLAVGSWSQGPYYVYSTDDDLALHGLAPTRLPDTHALQALLVDLAAANAGGDHILNLRPEYLAWQGDRFVVLPGAWVLPFEMLARLGARSPYQPPELRHAGLFASTTDGYMLGAVLAAIVDRGNDAAPEWLPRVMRMLALEPELRTGPDVLARELDEPFAPVNADPLRRSVERLSDVRVTAFGASESAVIEAMDACLEQLAAGRSSVVVIEGGANGAGLKQLFFRVRERLSFLTERPRVTWIEALSAWEPRDLVGDGGHVLLVPDEQPGEPQLLPLATLQWDRVRPFLAVVGMRRGAVLPDSTGGDVATWARACCGADVAVRTVSIVDAAFADPAPPTSPAARHLLDLLCVLEVDATAAMLRQALPSQEASLPEAIVELERAGHVRRQLDSGGWWGSELRLVLRALRPDVLEARRSALTPERREELHLLISHLLEHSDAQSLGQRYLRFHHLFAGGSWEDAVIAAEPLLKAAEKRGLDTLCRAVQRKLVSSNLVHHVPLPRLLWLLQRLGAWEVEHGKFSEGQSYYERAAERLFQSAENEADGFDFENVTAMILAHADLLERRVGPARALDLVQRFLERFGDRLRASDRGRLFSEQAYCELRLSRFNAAEDRCQVALKLLDARDDAKDVAQVYSALASIRWKTSRYEEAEQYFSTCLALREKIGDRLAVARVYNNLGVLYRAMHRFPESLEHHQRSVAIRQELGDEEGVARNLVNLGWVHFEMGNLDTAEEHAIRACRLGDDLGVPSTRALGKGLLGEIYLLQERMPEARAVLQEAIDETRALGDMAELFVNLRKFASLELRSGHLDNAEQRLREAEEYLSSAGSPLEEANWHLTHGELRHAQGDLRQAALSYEHAGNNLARLGNTRRAAEVFLKAAQLYHDSGVESRARDLVERARPMFARDGAGVTPKQLVDLEAVLGTNVTAVEGADSTRLVDALCRTAALAASSGSDGRALESILQELRAVSGARHVVVVGADSVPHRASVTDHAPGVEPPAILDHPRLVGRALQMLVPFGSDDVPGEKPARPFYVLPLEAADVAVGCIYLEWDLGAPQLEEAKMPVLRTIAQHVAFVLERESAPGMRKMSTAGDASPLAPAADETGLDSIIGRSSARQHIVDFVRQVRDLDATVLLMGDNGTGKEVVARAIHGTGKRRGFPLISINCTAIPEALWERELFGNEKGAFTDAHESRKGFFEAAHRGTMLLDEIGDMPWDMQTKLLRVLQDKTITRVGATEPTRVDVRIVAATNQKLEAAVEAGRFRRDLFHRINVLALTMPPLRERREDIPDLAKFFLKMHSGLMGLRPKTVSGEALRIMMRYAWPGNIRELENAMKGSLVLSNRDVLLPEDLPTAVLRGREGGETPGEASIDEVARWILDHAAYSIRDPLMESLEKALARAAVDKFREKTLSARMLGISKPTLYTRLK